MIDESSARQNYINLISEFTLPIVSVDDVLLPNRFRCGFYFQRHGKLFVLSAGHGIDPERQYWIETGFTPDKKRTAMFETGKFTEVYTKQEYDFSWSEVPYELISKKMNAIPELRERGIQIQSYHEEIYEPKKKNEWYGFAAKKQTGYLINKGEYKELERKLTFEMDMKYIGINEQDEYVFKLSGDHKGNKSYKGCSGSPITDRIGRVCSILVGGNEKDDTIYGVRLKNCVKKYLDG